MAMKRAEADESWTKMHK